ncbi:MAG: hypothetical protein PVJ57_19670 [Phycisphaerae bacterium]
MPPVTDAAPELVAGSYPALPATPVVRAWRISWPLALPAAVLAIIAPRRLGPHVAASSWVAAYLVHFMAIIVAVGSQFAYLWESAQIVSPAGGYAAVLTFSEFLRRPLAGFVLYCHTMLDSWEDVLRFLLVVLVIEAVVWLSAVVFVPMFAAGESRARLYLRSVKLVLWSTACFVPLATGVAYLVRNTELLDIPYPDMSLITYTLVLAGFAWWLSVLLRLGDRYGGPAAGPGWLPRALRCEGCAYELTMLPVTGRCPECGRPVAESLPERRALPTFARERGLLGVSVGYSQTLWAALFGTRFARTTCVCQGQRAARRFAVITAVLVGLLTAAAIAPWVLTSRESYDDALAMFYEFSPADAEMWRMHIWLVLLRMGLIGGLGFLGLLLAVGLLVTGFGFREATRRSVVLCYSAAWLLVPVVLGIGAAYAVKWIYGLPGMTREVSLPLLGSVERGLLLAAIPVVPPAAALLLWFLHLRRMLVETRYANG